MSATESKHVDAKAVERAAAKADVRVELSKKVRELKQEAEQIDGQIQELEVQAAREADEARVVELLAERSRLERRKEALPFLLRGTQARALRRQAATVFEEAADVKAELAAAEVDVESSTKRIPELQQQLDQAVKVLAEATGRRDQLAHQHRGLEMSASYAEADAKCIERGEPMKFEPSRFIG